MWYLCVISALHCWEEGPGLTIQGILAQGGAQVALYPQWDLVCSVLLRVPPHPRSSPVILGKVLGRGPGLGGVSVASQSDGITSTSQGCQTVE